MAKETSQLSQRLEKFDYDGLINLYENSLEDLRNIDIHPLIAEKCNQAVKLVDIYYP